MPIELHMTAVFVGKQIGMYYVYRKPMVIQSGHIFHYYYYFPSQENCLENTMPYCGAINVEEHCVDVIVDSQEYLFYMFG